MDNYLRHQDGNVLFLILIAVALFGALTYAVTQSNRSGRGGLERESLGILHTQITQFPLSVRTAIIRITSIATGASETVSFEWPGWGHTAYDPFTPQPDYHKVFFPDGGAIPFQKPTEKMLDSSQISQPGWGTWLFTGSTCIPGIGIGTDASCAGDHDSLDLIAVVPYIRLDLCRYINLKLGINAANGGSPPVDMGNAWGANPEFDGRYMNGEALLDSGNMLYQRESGCFEGGGTPPSGTYHYYMTLINR